MSKKQLSFTVKNLKPRNPMGTVKMTGGGKHIKSQKSVRQQGQKMIRNGFAGKDSFGESHYNKSNSYALEYKGSKKEPLFIYTLS